MGTTILTAQGQYFNFHRPEDHPYKIGEIAHALSHICRYTGHVERFYSVAQHSLLVSYLVPAQWALDGLLHDASEAYLGDVSSPLKALLPDYKAIEQRVEAAIALHFGLAFPLPSIVKHADLKMLVTEKRDLMIRTPNDEDHWPNITPCDMKVHPMSSETARECFLARFKELTQKGS
jgi:uncharacterized protein